MTTIAFAPRTTPHNASHSAPQAVRSIAPEAGVRLTRRGRVALTLLFVLAFLVIGTVVASTVSATGEQGAPANTVQVNVGEGDTLWDIAGAYAEPGKTKDMIREIRELNSLSSSTLQVGQVLAVPID